MNIFKYDEIDFKKINYDKPEKNGTFYYSSINYNKKPFQILSPKMKYIGDNKDLNTLICETINKDFSFYDFFLNLENRNIKNTFNSNKEWFGKEIPLDFKVGQKSKQNKLNFFFKLVETQIFLYYSAAIITRE